MDFYADNQGGMTGGQSRAGMPPNFEFEIVRVLLDGTATFIHAIHEPDEGGEVWLTMSLVRAGTGGRYSVRRQVTSRFRVADCLCLALAAAKYPTGDPADTETNKARITEFIDTVVLGDHPERIDEFVDRELFVSHTPGSCCRPEGLDTLLMRRRPRKGLVYHGIDDQIGHGNFVAVFSCFDEGGETFCACDLFRMGEGRIVEHWDVVERVERHSVAHNDDAY